MVDGYGGRYVVRKRRETNVIKDKRWGEERGGEGDGLSSEKEDIRRFLSMYPCFRRRDGWVCSEKEETSSVPSKIHSYPYQGLSCLFCR